MELHAGELDIVHISSQLIARKRAFDGKPSRRAAYELHVRRGISFGSCWAVRLSI